MAHKNTGKRISIQYDFQIFWQQRYGGISRYFFELISGMRQRDDVVVMPLDVFLSDNDYLRSLGSESIFRKIHFKGKRAIAGVLNRMVSAFRLKKQQFDIFHPTYYDPYCLKLVGNKPVVITICDLVDEKFYASLPAFTKLVEQRRKMIERADLVLTISENTKKDLINLYSVDPAKVKAIYLGNSLALQKVLSAPFRAKNRLLFIGNRKGAHKNFGLFAEAIAPLFLKDRELQLVCGGGGGFTKAELQFFTHLGIGEQVLYEPVTGNNSLVRLYSGATLFIYPSLYEGFGLPLVEAFTCGCPVAASKGSSIDEVGSDAAVYFDPADKASILQTVQRLLNDPELRLQLVEKGYRRAADFDWKKTVSETFAAYTSLLEL